MAGSPQPISNGCAKKTPHANWMFLFGNIPSAAATKLGSLRGSAPLGFDRLQPEPTLAVSTHLWGGVLVHDAAGHAGSERGPRRVIFYAPGNCKGSEVAAGQSAYKGELSFSSDIRLTAPFFQITLRACRAFSARAVFLALLGNFPGLWTS